MLSYNLNDCQTKPRSLLQVRGLAGAGPQGGVQHRGGAAPRLHREGARRPLTPRSCQNYLTRPPSEQGTASAQLGTSLGFHHAALPFHDFATLLIMLYQSSGGIAFGIT